jgi:hypothetical protein
MSTSNEYNSSESDSSPPKRAYHRTKPRSKEDTPRNNKISRKFYEANPNSTVEELIRYKKIYRSKARSIYYYANRNHYEDYKSLVVDSLPPTIEGISSFVIANEFKKHVQS